MKNSIKHLLSIGTMSIFALLFVGSATQKKATTPLKVATYSYAPPSTAPAKSAKVAFLLLNPQYAKTFTYYNIKVFSDFSKSMTPDFNALLTAKGYSVRGPFENYDAIVFSDKKESDLMLEVEIDLEVNTSNVKWKGSYVMGYPQGHNIYTFDGTMILSGKVNLTASETLTKEKLWAKSIPLTQKQITVASEQSYQLQNEYTRAFMEDPGIVNPVTDALEDFYKSVFNTAWNHLDPNELTPLKKQVDEIREKKKY